MVEYDLTKTIIPYLYRHLALPLLTHIYESGLFVQDQVETAQYELANCINWSITSYLSMSC